MMRSAGYAVLAALAAPAVYADVTIRYHTDSAMMPAALADQTIRIRRNRASFNLNGLTAVVDFAKQEITLVDAKHRMFATVPLAQYGAKIKAAIPAIPGFLEQMYDPAHTKVDTASTGRTETIQGLAAEERESTVTVDIPMPNRDSASGPQMKMTMRIWTAKSGEISRNPALGELASFSLWQGYLTRSAEVFPGQQAVMEKMVPPGSLMLRTHMEVSMKMPGAPSAAAPPTMVMNQEVAEISAAPVEDSLFRIPAEYTAAPFVDLFRGALLALNPQVAAVPVASGVKAYVPNLVPLHQQEPSHSEGVRGWVELLVTLDPQGAVAHAEVLAGPAALRQPALDAVKQWKYRPVVREGAAVSAYTDAIVNFSPRGGAVTMPDVAEAESATQRRMGLERQLPRSPQQILADLEQDSAGGGEMRRYYALGRMAKAAVQAGALDKASAYATEVLAAASNRDTDWNRGNAIHDGNNVLGLVALREGDVSKAGLLLLEAGRTPGSPQLNSFGPDMTLARELLAKGERGIVLQYLTLCRDFWKMGAQSLAQWTRTVQEGGTPEFGVNLR